MSYSFDMIEEITLYWLPHCQTCQKAADFLKAKDITISVFRNLKENTLSREEVEKLSKMAGGAAQLFSRRAIKYREMGLHQRELSDSEMLDLMTAEYTFIKRPVLVKGEKAIAGFSEKTFTAFFE
jgi:arsenate reductase